MISGKDINVLFQDLKNQVKLIMEEVSIKLKEEANENKMVEWEKNLWDGIYMDIRNSQQLSTDFKIEMDRLILKQKLVNGSEMSLRYF